MTTLISENTIVEITTESTTVEIVTGQQGPAGPMGPAGPPGADGGDGSAIWGEITGTLSNQTDLDSALAGKAAAGHNHSGVYEPADATILKSAAIGVSVASQGHNHTGIYESADATLLRTADVDDVPVNGATTVPVSSNWAYDHTTIDSHSNYALANPTHSAVTYNNGGTTTTLTVNGRNEIFSATVSGAVTQWVFAGAAAAGSVSAFTLELTNGAGFTQAWPLSVDWDNGSAPTLTAGVDVLTFYTRDGGTTWRGFLAASDSR
jgi:hypothetical protein